MYVGESKCKRGWVSRGKQLHAICHGMPDAMPRLHTQRGEGDWGFLHPFFLSFLRALHALSIFEMPRFDGMGRRPVGSGQGNQLHRGRQRSADRQAGTPATLRIGLLILFLFFFLLDAHTHTRLLAFLLACKLHRRSQLNGVPI